MSDLVRATQCAMFFRVPVSYPSTWAAAGCPHAANALEWRGRDVHGYDLDAVRDWLEETGRLDAHGRVQQQPRQPLVMRQIRYRQDLPPGSRALVVLLDAFQSAATNGQEPVDGLEAGVPRAIDEFEARLTRATERDPRRRQHLFQCWTLIKQRLPRAL